MRGDAAVAAGRDRDRERNELARLRVELADLRRAIADGPVAVQDVRRGLADLLDGGEELLSIRFPVEHHRGTSLLKALTTAEISTSGVRVATPANS